MRDPAELTHVIKRHLAGGEFAVEFDEGGRVTRVGDGIAHIDGLRKAMSGELLASPGDVVGMDTELLKEIRDKKELSGELRDALRTRSASRTRRMAVKPEPVFARLTD